jgi:UPF0716 protein FxsA
MFGPGIWPLALLGYVAAELFLFTVLAGKLGFILAFLLAVGKSMLGVVLLMTVLRRTLAGLQRQGGGMMVLQGGRLGRSLLGAILLIVPGFVSGLIGLWLLLPFRRDKQRRPPDGVVELSEEEWREVRERQLRSGPDAA